ncbi:MAG: hypothetical protein II398_10805 [Prevotella sp.]|nr:hypothetical protein [Prevotella sp.]
MKFLFLILLIVGVSLLSYYGTWGVLTLTGGFAWLGLACIIYFIGDMSEELVNLITKKRTPVIKVKGKRCELTDEELMKRLNEDNKKD